MMSEHTPPEPPPVRTKSRKPDIDMACRDPLDLNSHLKTHFSEVIGEPAGAHSDECVWEKSFSAFQLGKACCYTCLTYVCAIPLAFCWGCQFACITFMHIWSVTPLIKVFRINCDCAGKFFSAIVHCICDPFYEALALMFTKIYVHIVDAPGSFRERTYAGLQELAPPRTQQPPPPQGSYGGSGDRFCHEERRFSGHQQV